MGEAITVQARPDKSVAPKGETESRVDETERDPTAAWLKAVVEVADTDPWRCRLRAVPELEDREKRLKALDKLAEQVDVQRQPVRVLTQLAGRLVAIGAKLGKQSVCSFASPAATARRTCR